MPLDTPVVWLLNFSIAAMLILNAATFLDTCRAIGERGRSVEVRPLSGPSENETFESKKYFARFRPSRLHVPPPPPEIEFSQSELDEAIVGLSLPTWSRSYVHCNNSKSEVTCSQVVRAWRCLNGWSEYIKAHPFEDRKHFLMKHTYDGVGNRFSTDTTTFLIALMQNRSYIVEGTYPSKKKGAIGQAFEFHPAVQLRKDDVNIYFKSTGDRIKSNIQTFDWWYQYDYNHEINNKILYVDFLLYATMMYTHDQLSDFSRENFGMHAPYFVCNFLMRLPKHAIEEAKRATSKVPANVRIFGVHLRFQFPGQFYSYNVTTTIRTVLPFLKQKLQEMPTVFAFASDSPDMEKAFLKHFRNSTITVNTTRIADFDHDSALNDIALLEMSDEVLLTYRSTFSYVCAMRMGKRAWFVERESPSVFQASNSQATAVSALFHNWDVNDWQMNRRVHVTERNLEAIKYYCKYLLL